MEPVSLVSKIHFWPSTSPKKRKEKKKKKKKKKSSHIDLSETNMGGSKAESSSIQENAFMHLVHISKMKKMSKWLPKIWLVISNLYSWTFAAICFINYPFLDCVLTIDQNWFLYNQKPNSFWTQQNCSPTQPS